MGAGPIDSEINWVLPRNPIMASNRIHWCLSSKCVAILHPPWHAYTRIKSSKTAAEAYSTHSSSSSSSSLNSWMLAIRWIGVSLRLIMMMACCLMRCQVSAMLVSYLMGLLKEVDIRYWLHSLMGNRGGLRTTTTMLNIKARRRPQISSSLLRTEMRSLIKIAVLEIRVHQQGRL